MAEITEPLRCSGWQSDVIHRAGGGSMMIWDRPVDGRDGLAAGKVSVWLTVVGSDDDQYPEGTIFVSRRHHPDQEPRLPYRERIRVSREKTDQRVLVLRRFETGQTADALAFVQRLLDSDILSQEDLHESRG